MNTKIKLPSGAEIEGDFTPEQIVQITKGTETLKPIPYVPAPYVPNTFQFYCTCPTVWFGIYPPPKCAYCAAKGLVNVNPPFQWIPFTNDVVCGGSIIAGNTQQWNTAKNTSC